MKPLRNSEKNDQGESFPEINEQINETNINLFFWGEIPKITLKMYGQSDK